MNALLELYFLVLAFIYGYIDYSSQEKITFY
jgi:hypothetical protein